MTTSHTRSHCDLHPLTRLQTRTDRPTQGPSTPHITDKVVKLTCYGIYRAKKLKPLKTLRQFQSSRPPKGNSLHKNTSRSYAVQIIDIGVPVLAQLIFLPNSPKSFTLRCFSINQTPPKVPYPWGNVIHVPIPGPPNSISNCISIGSAVFSQLTAQSPCTLQCALKCS